MGSPWGVRGRKLVMFGFVLFFPSASFYVNLSLFYQNVRQTEKACCGEPFPGCDACFSFLVCCERKRNAFVGVMSGKMKLRLEWLHYCSAVVFTSMHTSI